MADEQKLDQLLTVSREIKAVVLDLQKSLTAAFPLSFLIRRNRAPRRAR